MSFVSVVREDVDEIEPKKYGKIFSKEFLTGHRKQG